MSAVVFIPLTRGKVAVIDLEDWEKVRPYKWHAAKMEQRWYAMHRFGKHGYCMPMHRLILGAPPRTQVDHRDGNGLNNQRYNIRVCTRAQNQQAYRRKPVGLTSRFRGVHLMKRDKVWVAQLGKRDATGKQKNYYLGRFNAEESAARAYDAAAKIHFGEFAHLNFP